MIESHKLRLYEASQTFQRFLSVTIRELILGNRFIKTFRDLQTQLKLSLISICSHFIDIQINVLLLFISNCFMEIMQKDSTFIVQDDVF